MKIATLSHISLLLQNKDLEPYPVGYDPEAQAPPRAARNSDNQIDFTGLGTFEMAKTLGTIPK